MRSSRSPHWRRDSNETVSGKPGAVQSGVALALVTESLGQGNMPLETGYMSLLSIEPAVDLAVEKFGFITHGDYPGRYRDTLFAEKFSDLSGRSLSSFIYYAGLYVYDDRDVFVEINCADEALLAEAIAAFDALTPLTRHDVVDGSVLYTPKENPSAELLLEGERRSPSSLRGPASRGWPWNAVGGSSSLSVSQGGKDRNGRVTPDRIE